MADPQCMVVEHNKTPNMRSVLTVISRSGLQRQCGIHDILTGLQASNRSKSLGREGQEQIAGDEGGMGVGVGVGEHPGSDQQCTPECWEDAEGDCLIQNGYCRGVICNLVGLVLCQISQLTVPRREVGSLQWTNKAWV